MNNNNKIPKEFYSNLGRLEFIYPQKIIDITVAIDKLDKIGLEKVNEELRLKGIPDKAITMLQPIILLKGSNREKLATLKKILKNSEIGIKGINELEYILNKIDTSPLRSGLEIDLTLARGLNYYTGAIVEVKALDVEIGSITGGGRYDNLTGVFGMPGISGVGISFGADRIFDVLNQLNLYPKDSLQTTQIMFVNFGETEEAICIKYLAQFRTAGIRAEIYPEAAKMKKQMGYADAKKINYVALVGETEIEAGKITLKNMITGEQQLLSAEDIISFINK